jgi:hypothetical protein
LYICNDTFIIIRFFENMKTFSATIAIALSLLAVSAHAQSGMSVENWKDTKIGPMLTGGLALNAGSVDSLTEAKTGLAYAVGARLQYPFSANMALDIALCYDGRSVEYDNTMITHKVTYNASYVSLRPGFNIGGIVVGVGLGLPIGGSSSVEGLTSNAFPDKIESKDLNMLIEGRLGANITIFESDEGNQLRLLVEGSYGFTKLLKSDSYPTGMEDAKNNGPLATAQIGVAYMFDMTPH